MIYDTTGQLLGRLLVVDDEPLVLEMLSETLRMRQHHVVSVCDAETALKEIERGAFDLVISDLHLPGLSGVDLLVRIKSVDPTLPVIVVTGQPALDKAIDAMKKGASDFITKPFSIEQIHHIVQKNLQERRLIEENQRLMAELNNKAVIEQLNRQLHQKISQITKLYRISEAFHSSVENQSLLQYMVDMASDLTDAQRVSLLTFDPARECLRIRASKGISSEILRKTSLEVGKGVAGQVAQERRPLRVTSHDQTSLRPPSNATYATHSWLSVPLFIGGELLGVLNMTDKADGSDFTEEDEYVAMTLAEKAAIKIENNALYEGIYSNLLDTLRSLVSTLEAKDAYTRHHSQRVTDISLKLARKVGCTEEECESVAFAGVLHDIGKVGINDNILLKTSRLTDAEYTIIKQHPVIGARIIEPLGLIQEERDIILHHHERIDGRGYPDGLKGSEIPFLARIVAIADSFDAMTSTRAYRKPRPMDEVLEEFDKYSGTQFDPELVQVFLEALEEGEIEAYGVDAEPQIGIEPMAEAEGS